MKTVAILTMLALLVGCAVKPQTTHTTHVVSIPEAMIGDCEVQAPPAIQEYLQSTLEQREKMLVDNIHDHITNLALCNVRLKNARDWNRKQKELYQKQIPDKSGKP